MGEYTIKEVKEIPARARTSLYDRIAEDLRTKEKGTYEISIPKKKGTNIALGLKSRLRKEDRYRISIRSGTCYVEISS